MQTTLLGQLGVTLSFMESTASSTHPTVPSPPHTSTLTLPGGSRVHSCRALEGASWDRSNTWQVGRRRRVKGRMRGEEVNKGMEAKERRVLQFRLTMNGYATWALSLTVHFDSYSRPPPKKDQIICL